jgi:hypothetical protein
VRLQNGYVHPSLTDMIDMAARLASDRKQVDPSAQKNELDADAAHRVTYARMVKP